MLSGTAGPLDPYDSWYRKRTWPPSVRVSVPAGWPQMATQSVRLSATVAFGQRAELVTQVVLGVRGRGWLQ